MHALAATIATALVIGLVAVQPLAGRRRYRRLLASLSHDPGARLRHYRRGLVGEWIAVGIVAVIGALAGRSPGSIGLASGPHPGRAGVETGEVAIVLVISAVLFRAPALREVVRRQARGFLGLLPRTRSERLTFAGLAVTAGICEEILFRGFGIAYVRWLWPSATDALLIVVTAAPFGLAHLYQGARGVVLTGIVGAFLASVVLSTGSLLPAIAMHALVDLRVLALPELEPADVARDQ